MPSQLPHALLSSSNVKACSIISYILQVLLQPAACPTTRTAASSSLVHDFLLSLVLGHSCNFETFWSSLAPGTCFLVPEPWTQARVASLPNASGLEDMRGSSREASISKHRMVQPESRLKKKKPAQTNARGSTYFDMLGVPANSA